MPHQHCQSPTGCHQGRSVGGCSVRPTTDHGFLLTCFTSTKTRRSVVGDAKSRVTWATGCVQTVSVVDSPGSSQVTRSAYGEALSTCSAGPRPCWKCDQPS